jgi:hypothetical protein
MIRLKSADGSIATVAHSAGDKLVHEKHERIYLTPTGLLMEGDYPQVPFCMTISAANTPTNVATIEDLPRERGSLTVRGKKERK